MLASTVHCRGIVGYIASPLSICICGNGRPAGGGRSIIYDKRVTEIVFPKSVSTAREDSTRVGMCTMYSVLCLFFKGHEVFRAGA